MASTDVSSGTTSDGQGALGYDLSLEVVTVPVSDVTRAVAFYKSLGWRLDADIAAGDFRVVQFTPPHSPCSIHFGTGLTSMEPGSLDRLILTVENIDAARADLIGRGVDVGEVYESAPPGFEPQGRSYFAYAAFSDPDGNGWLLQEVTTRIPGRMWDA